MNKNMHHLETIKRYCEKQPEPLGAIRQLITLEARSLPTKTGDR